jgi:hypothetical protein
MIIFPLLAITSAVLIYLKLKSSPLENLLPSTLNKEWINKDVKMMEEILPVLQEMPEFDNLLLIYNSKKELQFLPPHERNKGLGYSTAEFNFYGGYSKIYVYIITDENGKSIYSVAYIRGKKQAMDILDSQFNFENIQGSKFSYLYEEAYIDLRHKNTSLYEKYINDFYGYFQINTDIYIPDELRTDYETLLNASTYGYIVGFGLVTLEERKAFEKILETNNKDIFLTLIPTPNPQTTMYAIEGLFKNREYDIKNENEYTDILDKIVALNFYVTVGRDSIYNKIINSKEDIYDLIYFIKENPHTN